LACFSPHHHSFTGWVDVALSPKGEQEAKEGGALIKEAGIDFDVAFTSLQKRAIKTCFLALESADQLWIPQKRSWRLNERMYGDLEGMNKNECVEKYGADQVCCIVLSLKGNRFNFGRLRLNR
jgi:2,3-bisphosphoglycerate-dependent phosphoglycerate mutase